MIGTSKNIDAIIKNLVCMRNIDEELIPKFKFFQVKKSAIKTSEDESDK
jgi:hypothetical protein